MAGRSRMWEHPSTLSGIPSLGMPPHPTDEPGLQKPVSKRAIRGNQREPGHNRRAFLLVRQRRAVPVSQIGKRQVRYTKTFRDILDNLFLELAGQAEEPRRLRNISVLSPASPGIPRQTLPWPPIPTRRIHRRTVYRPFISRFTDFFAVIDVAADKRNLSG